MYINFSVGRFYGVLLFAKFTVIGVYNVYISFLKVPFFKVYEFRRVGVIGKV